ncbi:hypothetical protein HDA32_001113 [Spinactinospora alkalitolerans]|uniref:Uncharacterized protein n=1 Tax=Spinactinospora alkalitolerans TaxID=687207 RepID=A0A852TTB9_9ACTN|nr:hypothetical protein [Spinactinospora alkalitolerans]NYE45993.1 hypothetical protein [Spinactinospora alkalitolerans]
MVRELWDSGSPDAARLVASPTSTRATVVEDEVLPRDWRLLLFQDNAPHGLALYAVAGPEGSAMVLSRRPEGYAKFADEAGIGVDSTDEALTTAEFFLDRTRALHVHQSVLHTPSDAVLSRFADVSKAEEQLERAVKAPSVKQTRNGYRIILYVQRGDRVDRWKGAVTRSGRIEGAFTTVIEGLPVDLPR